MVFEKKQAFCVVVGRNGDRSVIEGLPEDGERMERHLEATSLLAAHKAAFGRLPDLDPGILPDTISTISRRCFLG